ncbi:transketolase [Enterococcus cecorum]|uniref:transketolase n=1 Tax=Enterococcus cecorum TaxID=44008 RepID=UPI001FABF4C9|nr:transketolase [Enterococcus cecorum]MCJ0595001.1 transketolase [Enterococcus cecorum]
MRDIDIQSVAAIRSLVVDSVENAKHGHMGAPLGTAPMGYELFKNHMHFNPKNPKWFNRDRFVLTSGHGSMLQYALLHLCGYDLSIDDLKHFRQIDSKTPGHPEVHHTPGVEATTGPLGQGFSMTVGLAIAQAHLAERFNKKDIQIISNYIYTICGDGDLEEGVAMEAAAIAGNLGLGKLIVLYDSNDVTSDGPIELSSREHIRKKFEAMNWQTLLVNDGNDIVEIGKAIEEAKKCEDMPTLIEVKTIIGFGSTLQGTEKIHSNPVGEVEAEHIKKSIHWEYAPFEIPDSVRDNFAEVITRGEADEKSWNELLEQYKQAYPDEYKLLKRIISGEAPALNELLVPFSEEKMATRSASGKVLNKIYQLNPVLVGGSADLASSNKTTIEGKGFMNQNSHVSSNVHFGVREFAMASIINGITLYGGLRGYCGTFLVFSDYMRSAIRHAALMETPSIFVMTHDSLQVGQDGPTHQPVEHLLSLRAMPNLVLIRPAEANETIAAWKLAMESKNRPFVIALGRHDVQVNKDVSFDGVAKGAYVISKDADEPELILIATGSEVEVALEAKKKLTGHKINVVSMPSWELFDEQDEDYKESVLPKSVSKRISVELGTTLGWQKYVGCQGKSIGIDKFGKSAPAKDLLNDYDFTIERIVKEVEEMLAK